MKNRIKLIALFGVLIFFINCKSSDIDVETPSCIETKISEILTNKVSNPPTQIWKWEVDDEVYYYITSDCCDQYNYLYSENCEIICAPDGGIVGNGDGKCPNFSTEITKTLIWEDKRS